MAEFAGEKRRIVYSIGPDGDYEPRCSRCHRVYDGNFKKKESAMADELQGDKVGPQAGSEGGNWQTRVMAAGGAPTTPAGCDSRKSDGDDKQDYTEPNTPGVGYKSPAFNSPARGK